MFGRGAAKLHRQGKLAEAERAYRRRPAAIAGPFRRERICSGSSRCRPRESNWPSHASAGDRAEHPDHAEAHNNRGAALAHLGRFAEALADYDAAIALKPDHVGRLHQSRCRVGCSRPRRGGAVQLRDGHHAAARIRLKHNQPCGRAGETRPSGAGVGQFRHGDRPAPEHALAHYNRGNVTARSAAFDEAVASYDRAIALRPDLAGAHNNRGAVLADLGRSRGAISIYETAIALRPNAPEAYNNLGAALVDLGGSRTPWHVRRADRSCSPIMPARIKNRGAALAALGRLDGCSGELRPGDRVATGLRRGATPIAPPR